MDTLEVTNELLDVEVNMNTNTTTAISATNTIIRTRTMTSKMILLAFLFLDSFVVSFSAEPTWLGIFLQNEWNDASDNGKCNKSTKLNIEQA